MADGDPQIESYQYPNAHIGHLTEYQQAQLTEFKRLVQQDGNFGSPGSGDPALAGHDDESLLLVFCPSTIGLHHLLRIS